MIGFLLSFIGKSLTGPLVDIAGSFFRSQADREKIRGDIAINRETTRGLIEVTKTQAQASESISSIEAESDLATRRPVLMVIAQTILWGVALFYFAMLIAVSSLPVLDWEVNKLPGLWEFLTLAVLAGLAGPQVLNLLKRRFGL